MSDMRGFASAQRHYENMEPDYAAECVCPPVFACAECGEVLADGKACTEPDCEGAEVEQVERDGDTPGAVASCPLHGWCTGCSSRRCEDCNG